MAGITLAQAEAQLALYLDAEQKILAGQSVTLNGRSLSRADLDAVQRGINSWNKRVQRLDRGSLRTYNAVPQG